MIHARIRFTFALGIAMTNFVLASTFGFYLGQLNGPIFAVGVTALY
jgi:hypothetical protein